MNKEIKTNVLIATSTSRSELLISRSLHSVLNQTLQPSKILIVDDNDDENESEKIEKALKDINCPYLFYIKNYKTKGMSGTGAWNSGIEWFSARCDEDEYIAILDDDDEWDNFYIEKITAAINKEDMLPDQAVSFLHRTDCPNANIFSKEDLTIKNFLKGNPGIQGSNMFFKLSTLVKVNGFDETLDSCTDRDLMISVLKSFPKLNIAIVNEVLVKHYANPVSVTYNVDKKRKGLDRFFTKHIAEYEKDDLYQSLERSEKLFKYQNAKAIKTLYNKIDELNTIYKDEEKIVVGVALHNSRNSIRQCLTSILEQEGNGFKVWILIADDDSDDNWKEEVEDLLSNPRIVVANVHYKNVSKTRNFLNSFIINHFPNVQLIGRLDSDDVYASYDVLSQIEVLYKKTNCDAILAGNYLKLNGKIIERVNRADKRLLDKEFLMNKLRQMAEGDPNGELPSCNTFLTPRSIEIYPEIPSAEDHYLTVKLLLNDKYKIAVAEDVLLTVYDLDGSTSTTNKKLNKHREARVRLYNEVLNGNIL